MTQESSSWQTRQPSAADRSADSGGPQSSGHSSPENGAGAPALESRILRVFSAVLGETEIHKQLCEQTRASPQALETAIHSPHLRGALADRQAAFLVEQTVELLRALADGVHKRESWACKMVLEMTGLSDLFRGLLAVKIEEEKEIIFSSDYERALFENVRELMLCKETESK